MKILVSPKCRPQDRRLMAWKILFLTLALTWSLGAAGEPLRPNILWITSEDNGPHLGCYGDTYATTPNLDALARRGLRYTHAWSNAPVCAPARTALISGLYPPATGAEHMRSLTRLPQGFRFYPQYLRDLGYYCTNNSKEDYNLVKPGKVWDASDREAHWKHRAEGQPFFAVFNHTVSHESQIRRRPHQAVHDPAQVRIPAYHPDRPEVRADWAQYYDKLSEMDALVGKNLEELEEAGLSDDTIVFYYGDHGSGMPRSKRWPYESGLRVPLIVHFPEKFRHLAPPEYQENGSSSRLVSFVDLAPTLLSLVGTRPPDYYQGHAFAGPYDAGPQPYLYGFRGRMDERYDLVRAVRDDRYLYVRHYMPHKIYGQYIDYMFKTPTTRIWQEMYDRGELNEVQSRFWQPKPTEELYDLQEDVDEVRNLASSPEHQDTLDRLRRQQEVWALQIGDLGFLPEGEVHARAGDDAPYHLGRDPQRYPLVRIMAAAGLAAGRDAAAVPGLRGLLRDADSAVSFWGILGLIIRGEEAVRAAKEDLVMALDDTEVYPRVTAALALAQFGEEEGERGMAALMAEGKREDLNEYERLWLLNALADLGADADPAYEVIRSFPENPRKGENPRMGSYGPDLRGWLLQNLKPGEGR